MRRREDESPAEFLRRVVSWIDHEDEGVLDALPSVEALFDYVGLWTDYDTDFLQSIFEVIEEGLDSPDNYHAFLDKWNIPWKRWDSDKNEWYDKEIKNEKSETAEA